MSVTGLVSPSDEPTRAPETDQGHGLVRAAGAVCWREVAGTLEVLLVHRPRYHDWSWPKGKLDPGESVVAAAAREVEEETGLRIRLGIPLPPARYRLAGRSMDRSIEQVVEPVDKHVTYWAAHVAEGPLPPVPRPQEVDRTEWVDAHEAASRLTRRGDRLQLGAVVDAHSGGVLDTFPVLVLRHGHARPKTVWGRDDGSRPLVEVGVREAEALVPVLSAWSPGRVVSSPWERCVASVRPYLDATDATLRTKGRLSEDGHRRNAAKVSRLVTKLIEKGRPVLVCTHRPVLGTLLGTVAGHASVEFSGTVPHADPFLQPGEVLVAHVSRRSRRVVAVEQHRPVLT